MDAQTVVKLLTQITTPHANGQAHKRKLTEEEKQIERDRAVWDEEEASGQFDGHIPDIRDPRVRAEVKRIQREQEAKLEERLIAAGLHVMQRRG